MSRSIPLVRFLCLLMANGWLGRATEEKLNPVPSVHRQVTLFPLRGQGAEGQIDPLTQALKNALRATPGYEVLLFTPSSPPIRRALADARISEEQLEDVGSPATRLLIARALSTDAALSGELQVKTEAEGHPVAEVMIEILETHDPRVMAFRTTIKGWEEISTAEGVPEPEAASFWKQVGEILRREIEAHWTTTPSPPPPHETPAEEEVLPPPEASLDELIQAARALGANKRYPEALEAYTRAIQQTPKEATLYLEVGQLYEQMEDWTNAAREYERATRVAPQQARAYRHLGHVYRRLAASGDQAARLAALKALRQAAELQPEDETLQQELAEAYEQAGYYEWAVATYEALLKKAQDPYAILLRLGQMAEQRQEYPQAMARYAAALKRDPHQPEAHERMAFLLLRLGETDQAFKELQRRVSLAEGPVQPSDADHFSRWLRILDQEARRQYDQLSLLLSAYQDGKADREATLRGLEQQAETLQALLAVAHQIAPPAPYAQSYRHRTLSYSLLDQAVAEYLAYLDTEDPVSLERGVLWQTQAHRELATAQGLEMRVVQR